MHVNLNRKKWCFWFFFSLSKDSWSELLPTLTRADADLPALYFLGATDTLLIIGGNNTETVMTSFCLQAQRWGQVQIKQRSSVSSEEESFLQYTKTKLSISCSFLQVYRTEKVAFVGQGTITGDHVLLMPSIEHNSVARMDLQTLLTRALPPLPITTRYEAIFYLHF